MENNTMLEKVEGFTVLLCYCLAAISGGIGGCAVTAGHFINSGGTSKVQMRASWLLAYGIVGSVFGLLFAVYSVTFGSITTYTEIVGPALLSGIVGASSLSCVNMTARFVLKRLGIEVVVTVQRDQKQCRK